MGKTFRHYLNFIDPPFGRFEITEPVGFDSSTFTIEQESERFARDVTFGNEEVDETYWDGVFEWSGVPYVFNTGVVAYHLTMGFERIVAAYEQRGAEARIERIIARNGVDFVTGILDTATAEYNGRNEFKCKTIQDVPRAVFKRRASEEVDIFDTKDMDGNVSVPCTTVRTLLKAKPVFQETVFDSSGVNAVVTIGATPFPAYFNGIKNVVSDGLLDTLSWFDNASVYNYGLSAYDGIPWGFQALRAKETLTDVSAEMNLNISVQLTSPVDSAAVRGYFMKGPDVSDLASWFALNSVLPRYQFFDTGVLGVSTGNFTYNFTGTVNVDLPNMEAGEILYFFFVHSGELSTIATGFGENRVKISATSTSIDSVIEGVWVHDALTKCVDMTTDGMVLNAPLFANGGIHHDQIVVSGLLLRQAKDRPFLLKAGELFRSVTKEVCCDYKVKTGEIEIKRRDTEAISFYPNIEVGAFMASPSENFSNYLNPKFQLQSFGFGYKIYEQSKDATDSLDEVHTIANWSLPTKSVDEKLEISIDHWRGPFKFEEIRKIAVTPSKNTSLPDDNNYGILDLVRLPPGTTSGFSRTLTMLASGFQLKILTDGTFSWNLLGFNVGDTFTILSGQNSGTYIVDSINAENTIITLNSSGLVLYTGPSLIKVVYPLNNVLWVNRTTEEFQTVADIKSPKNYSNLQYSIKRNMQYWLPYLATACQFLTGFIRCQSFKNSKKANGSFIPNLTTEFRNGGLIVDNADIDISTIAGTQPITPYIDEITLVADFDDVLLLCKNIEATDGFIRYQRPNMVGYGYPISLSYNWATGSLDAKMEVRYIGSVLTINGNGGGTIQINGTPYTMQQLYANGWFMISNDYLQLYDANYIQIVNPILFNTVLVNGVLYNDRINFEAALMGLI